jgi:hypothetical protein
MRLSMEAEFQLKAFETVLKNASRDQAIQLAMQVFRAYLIHQQVARELIKGFSKSEVFTDINSTGNHSDCGDKG